MRCTKCKIEFKKKKKFSSINYTKNPDNDAMILFMVCSPQDHFIMLLSLLTNLWEKKYRERERDTTDMYTDNRNTQHILPTNDNFYFLKYTRELIFFQSFFIFIQLFEMKYVHWFWLYLWFSSFKKTLRTERMTENVQLISVRAKD